MNSFLLPSKVVNPGAAIKASIPLVEKTFGIAQGLKAGKVAAKTDTKDIEISLSKNALKRTGEGQSESGARVSGSPLGQALDALSEIADKIDQLQAKYGQSAIGSASSKSMASELEALAKEFARITENNIFKSSYEETGSLGFSDASVKAVFASGDQTKISEMQKGLDGLGKFSFENVLTDRSLTKSIKDLISSVRNALNTNQSPFAGPETQEQQKNSLLLSVPKASIKTAGAADGLTVALLSYSNEDLLKAAASHTDISATNVLLLTFNRDEEEEETELEKQEREKKEQKMEIENPSDGDLF